MAQLPELDPGILKQLPPDFKKWWQAFKPFMNNLLSTDQDLTLNTKGKGVVLKNPDGTISKRVRLNDAGDGIIIEDV